MRSVTIESAQAQRTMARQPVLETAQVTPSVGAGLTLTPPGRLVASKVIGSEASVGPGSGWPAFRGGAG